MAELPLPPPTRRRYFLTGLLTLIPLWVTWLVVAFLFRTLSSVGHPFVNWLSIRLRPNFPNLESFLTNPVFLAVVSFVAVLVFIYVLGVLSTAVIGKRIMRLFEWFIEHVPFVKDVYRAVKKLTTALQDKPGDDVQRVVLIDFPSPEMKTVGLVTRILTDSNTGRKLAAVYVPTTPNPTSGYLEIVPIERLTPTQWTMDEAMNFIISGGAIAPETMAYDPPGTIPTEQSETADGDIDAD